MRVQSLRPHRRLLLAVAFVAAAALPASAVEVTGRVLAPGPTGPVPVACCEVIATVKDTASGATTSEVTAYTGSDGTFAVTVRCLAGVGQALAVRATCCDAEAGPFDITDCAVGALDVGDLTCSGAPTVEATLLTGSVVCRDAVFVEPVADCAVTATSALGTGLARTDARGRWELCHPCDPAGPTPVSVLAQCCGAARDVEIAGCAETLDVGQLRCPSCPDLACAEAGAVELSGRVLCRDPSGGIVPVDGCVVALTVEGCGVVTMHEATTGMDGVYRTCVPCPAAGPCAAWTVSAVPACCPDAASGPVPVRGCTPSVGLPELLCDPGAAGCPPEVRPCGDAAVRVAGLVTCLDGDTGERRPVPSCDVQVTPMGCASPPVTVTTGPDGRYEACVECELDCTGVLVESACCAAADVAAFPFPCPPEVGVDLACDDCGGLPVPRDCPPPDAILVRGSVICASTGLGVAAFQVEISGIDLGGAPLEPVIAIADASGTYRACVPCGPGVAELEIVHGCGPSIVVPVDGCPAELDVPELIECTDCDPCPGGLTRVQGRLLCRGGAPVAGCAVTIEGSSCSEAYSLEVVTDARGWYEACVPCGCPRDGPTRVTAACCGASTTVHAGRCRSVTPVRPLFCHRPCR